MLADDFSPSTLEAEAVGRIFGEHSEFRAGRVYSKTLLIHNTGQISFVNNSFAIKEEI